MDPSKENLSFPESGNVYSSIEGINDLPTYYSVMIRQGYWDIDTSTDSLSLANIKVDPRSSKILGGEESIDKLTIGIIEKHDPKSKKTQRYRLIVNWPTSPKNTIIVFHEEPEETKSLSFKGKVSGRFFGDPCNTLRDVFDDIDRYPPQKSER